MLSAKAAGRPARRHRGFALVEGIVTMAIVLAMAAAAAPSFHRLAARSTLRQATTRLIVSLEAARAVALANGTAVRFAPRPGTAGFRSGWQVVLAGHAESGRNDMPGAGAPADPSDPSDRVVLAVALDHPCLDITLHGTDAADVLHMTGMGYSRSVHGGFYAGRFRLRCGPLERQVRLGPLGQIRACTPGVDRACGSDTRADTDDDGSGSRSDD